LAWLLSREEKKARGGILADDVRSSYPLCQTLTFP
jgi:hypothetical protein